MAADPLLPSLVALIVAVPFERAVTRPVLETVATFVELVVQAMVLPESVRPLASRSVADS